MKIVGAMQVGGNYSWILPSSLNNLASIVDEIVVVGSGIVYPEIIKIINEKFGDQSISCTGDAGTIIFCDTTGLHKGGHSISKPRYLLNACFRSNGSYWRYSQEHKDSIANFRENNFSSELVQYSVQ